ncbi:MAG: hypothetical protein GC150_02900 [Rhizobiales bacterium]|nr:hypothetical protein [Hyphomicrobiales bacterium]
MRLIQKLDAIEEPATIGTGQEVPAGQEKAGTDGAADVGGAGRYAAGPVRHAGVRGPNVAAALAPHTVRVWDLPVRLFHWMLVASVTLAWFTADFGGSLHARIGYVVLGLVVFRLIWGLIGSRHARFSDFVPSPGILIGYLGAVGAGHPPRHLGHNPAGAAMIVLLLALLAVVCASGWMMLTRQYFGVSWVANVHDVAAHAIVWLIPLHVAGALFSGWIHRENLVLAMVTGRKRAPDPDELSEVPATVGGRPTILDHLRETFRSVEQLAFVVALVSAGAVAWMVYTGPEAIVPQRTIVAVPPADAEPIRPADMLGANAIATLATQLSGLEEREQARRMAQLVCSAMRGSGGEIDNLLAFVRSLGRPTLRELQAMLIDAGLYRGGIDGEVGRRTEQALRDLATFDVEDPCQARG